MAEPLLISYGSSSYEKKNGRDTLPHLFDAISDCLGRAGLFPGDVDGLALASFTYPPGNVITLAEHLDMRLRWAEDGSFGGASGVVAVGRAADQIRLGHARCILCVAGDAFTTGSHEKLLEDFTPALSEHLGPHGFGGANGVLAPLQTRHAALYGTRRDQLGRLCVTQRRHAMLNPNALFQTPLTLDEFLEARVIAEPFHLYDCVMPCSGAEAVLVVADDIAASIGRPGVRVVATREMHNASPGQLSEFSAGWEVIGEELWAATGRQPGDMDFAQLYDDYPIVVGLQLEGYGFCGRGECGSYLEKTDVSNWGELPLNTGGGQLSVGQAGAGGAMIHLVEAVQQLQHEAGERQVAGAQRGLVSGYGLVSYGKGLCTAATVLERLDS